MSDVCQENVAFDSECLESEVEWSQLMKKELRRDRTLIILGVLEIVLVESVLNLHRQMTAITASWPSYNRLDDKGAQPTAAAPGAHSKTIFRNFDKLSEANRRLPALSLIQTSSHLKTVFNLMFSIDHLALLLNYKCHLGRVSLHWDCANTALTSSFTLVLLDFTFSAYIQSGHIHVTSQQTFSDPSMAIKHITHKLYTYILEKALTHTRAILGPEAVGRKGNVVEFRLGVFHPVLGRDAPPSTKKAVFQLALDSKTLFVPKLFVVNTQDPKPDAENIWEQLIGDNFVDKITGLIFKYQQ